MIKFIDESGNNEWHNELKNAWSYMNMSLIVILLSLPGENYVAIETKIALPRQLQ